MNIIVNKTHLIYPEGTSIEELIHDTTPDFEHIAVAINHKIIAREAWSTTYLTEGDSVSIISPAMGG